MVGLDSRGAIVAQEKVSRGRIASRLANSPRCLIGIEAGMATHYVARELAALGHYVKQVPPTDAKPFRQGHNGAHVFSLLALAKLYLPAGQLRPPDDTKPSAPARHCELAALTEKRSPKLQTIASPR